VEKKGGSSSSQRNSLENNPSLKKGEKEKKASPSDKVKKGGGGARRATKGDALPGRNRDGKKGSAESFAREKTLPHPPRPDEEERVKGDELMTGKGGDEDYPEIPIDKKKRGGGTEGGGTPKLQERTAD